MKPSRKIYFQVFNALILLLVLTVVAAYLPFGPILGPVINLSIAVAKAVLILLFFMHLRDSDQIVATFAVAGFYWLLILVSLTLSDYFTRT